jgi:Ser/Thr protein kinase RdoA (MazF antagonist)
MDVFATLSYDQQAARLTRTAQASLRNYSLANASVSLVLYVHNAMFRVTTPAGEVYALRLQLTQRRKPFEQTRSELRWLSALKRDTPLQVPEPVLSDQGYITLQPVEDMADEASVVLFRWLEESHATDTFSAEQARQAGQFLGQLHAHSRQYALPTDFVRPRFDWEGLFGPTSIYHPGENRAIFTPAQISIFEQVAGWMQRVMAELAGQPGSFGLIHADFLRKNMLFNSQGIAGIDFDDCGFGFYLYDLAPLLLQLRDEPDYEALRGAFLDGYGQVFPLTSADETTLENMIAARLLGSCYWIAANLHNPRIRAKAPTILDYRAEVLREFMDTGRVSRRGEQF